MTVSGRSQRIWRQLTCVGCGKEEFSTRSLSDLERSTFRCLDCGIRSQLHQDDKGEK